MLRYNFATPGSTYDPVRDAFILPRARSEDGSVILKVGQ
jgi:hypothetical protein